MFRIWTSRLSIWLHRLESNLNSRIGNLVNPSAVFS